ncbi:hypothetical protein Naga_100505g1 [Nannochloropsis gaditana]|uniref:Uncharacterized protein n=1 Tax=Nannochloropsis gaditana TaxID=72520 RepID=W7TLX3_9STRA|nr:hypothetical protein Naga_100505g1 [Nannochloropsis gaditana]
MCGSGTDRGKKVIQAAQALSHTMADSWDEENKDKETTRSAPQKSWADDDDDFTPVRPTVQKEVTYPAPQRTAVGPSRDGGFGGATAASRDFSDGRGARGEGDFSNFGSRRGSGRGGGREGGYRGSWGPARGPGGRRGAPAG